MIETCKFCNPETGICSNVKLKRYSHCTYSDPKKCFEFELKRTFKGIMDYETESGEVCE